MATLRLISSMAPREALAAAIAAYQHNHALTIQAQAAGGVEVARRVAAGLEAVDVVVLSNDAIDKLVAAGQLSTTGRIDLMTSEIAVAVPAGARHPDLRNEMTVKAAVMSAASVGYSTGPSGRYLERLFDRWGVLESVRPRIVVPAPGVPVASLVASGKVQLGFQQLSELLGVTGIDVVGTLPPQIQHVTTFTAALSLTCADIDNALDFLAFVASPQRDALKQRYGMAGTARPR
jgi:molybdate transport system substrate-binding protein